MTSSHPIHRRSFICGATAILAGWACPGIAVPNAPELRSRVAPPDDAVVAIYTEAGATGAKPHALTDREWALVEAAIAKLPQLHRAILDRHLARLSFIDAPQSAGTALTRDLGPDGPERRFDITLRADILDKTLTQFLNEKESQLFDVDGSGTCLQIEAGTMPALTYILLHEATHVVDKVMGLTAPGGAMARGDIWKDYRGLAPLYDRGPIASSSFRRGPKIPLARATSLYAALDHMPFTTVYATASAGEDLAELVAWQQLSTRFGAGLRIEVRDLRGKLLHSSRPLRSPLVRARFADVEKLLSTPPR